MTTAGFTRLLNLSMLMTVLAGRTVIVRSIEKSGRWAKEIRELICKEGILTRLSYMIPKYSRFGICSMLRIVLSACYDHSEIITSISDPPNLLSVQKPFLV